MLENFSAMHNSPLGTLENGFGGMDTELNFNNELVARHWDNLKTWQDAGAFKWGGRVLARMPNPCSTPRSARSSLAPLLPVPTSRQCDFGGLWHAALLT